MDISINKRSMIMKSGARSPKCTRCRNHGIVSPLRGHKHKCTWRNCSCHKCQIVSEKQRLTATRIALYRHQVSSESKELDEAQCSHDSEAISCEDLDCHSIEYKEPLQSSPNRSSPCKHDTDRDDCQTNSPTGFLDRAEELQEKDELIKNLDIIQYVFPFYDLRNLERVLRNCNNNLLHAVLSLCQTFLSYPMRVEEHNDDDVMPSQMSLPGPSMRDTELYKTFQRDGNHS